MQLSIEPLIYIGIFVGIIMLVEGVYLAIFGKSISLNARVNRPPRDAAERDIRAKNVLAKLRKEMDQHKGSVRLPLYTLIADKAQKANIAFSPGQLILVMLGLAVAGPFLGLTILTSASLPIRLLAAIAYGRRRRVLLDQLQGEETSGDDRRTTSGRSGADGAVAARRPPLSSRRSTPCPRKSSDPLASELGVIADEAAYGREPHPSRSPSVPWPSVWTARICASSLVARPGIQQTSGGNLAEILAGSGQR